MKRKTTQIGIPYYVKDNFLTEYQGSIERLENSVEEEYIVNMKQNCYRERNYRKYIYLNYFFNVLVILNANMTDSAVLSNKLKSEKNSVKILLK